MLLRANAERAYGRLKLQREASHMIDLLKVLLRLARDTQSLSDKHSIQLQSQLQEIGRLLGGWMKSTDAKNSGTESPELRER